MTAPHFLRVLAPLQATFAKSQRGWYSPGEAQGCQGRDSAGVVVAGSLHAGIRPAARPPPSHLLSPGLPRRLSSCRVAAPFWVQRPGGSCEGSVGRPCDDDHRRTGVGNGAWRSGSPPAPNLSSHHIGPVASPPSRPRGPACSAAPPEGPQWRPKATAGISEARQAIDRQLGWGRDDCLCGGRGPHAGDEQKETTLRVSGGALQGRLTSNADRLA